jgi:hypothetical protein
MVLERLGERWAKCDPDPVKIRWALRTAMQVPLESARGHRPEPVSCHPHVLKVCHGDPQDATAIVAEGKEHPSLRRR